VTGAAGKLTAVAFVRLVQTVVVVIADFVARDTFVRFVTLEVCAATFERTRISDALERRVCTRTERDRQTDSRMMRRHQIKSTAQLLTK